MKRDLAAMAAREHDLLVIGGGIHGAFAAWDAAQRGLSVALVEAGDFGGSTSWNSLKTIHGGLRYLQSADLRRMRESIRERRTLLRIAPRLVRPLRFVVPTYGHGPKGREALALALFVNDLVSADRNAGLPPEARLPRGRSLSRTQLQDLVPGLDVRGVSGGGQWTDAQVQSSERLLVGVLHAASAAGAALANHARVTALVRDGSAVVGASVEDAASGDTLEVLAKATLNAAGPAMDDVLALAGVARPRVPLLRAVNLILRRSVAAEHAVGAVDEGRYLFCVPWTGRALLGTGYAPADGPDGARRFFESAVRAYPWAKLVPEDVALVHRGRVPGEDARRLSTRHQLVDHAWHGASGLVSVQGVKYTTARGVAEEAIDRVAARLARATRCRTAQTVLERAAPLEGGLATRTTQAVREEMATSLADAVLRRLDLGTAGPPPAPELDVVAATMATELGWDAAKILAERRELAAAFDAAAL